MLSQYKSDYCAQSGVRVNGYSRVNLAWQLHAGLTAQRALNTALKVNQPKAVASAIVSVIAHGLRNHSERKSASRGQTWHC